MRRVLLVDDEPRALSGIRRTFPWKAFGFQVVVETTDPAEALRAILEGGIDLALVDIRMPEISGLDLIRAARTGGAGTEFILISGYAEFEFAQEALRLGALDYCLKPVKAEAAEEILRKAALRLDGPVKDRPGSLPADIEKDPMILRDRFPDPLPLFQAVVSEASDGGTAAFSLPRGARAFRTHDGRETVHVLNLETDLRGDPSVAAPAGQRVGIGGAYRCLEDIPASIDQARRALGGAFLDPARTVFPYRPARPDEVEAVVSDILTAIAEGDLSGLQALFTALPERIRRKELTIGDLEHLRSRIVAAIRLPEGGEAAGAAEEFSAPAIRRAFPDLEGYCAHLAGLCIDGQATTGFRAFHRARGNPKVLAILSHVHAHLGGDLSMQTVAHRLHFHPNYGSGLFKSTVGVAFSEYVARVRLQKAKHLLLGTSLPLGGIAGEVGYEYYHFIKTFRKREGMSPARFRHAGGVRPEPDS